MNKFKFIAVSLFIFILATASFASPKDRLDNWKARGNWPFGTSDNQITMGFLKDATKTDLSKKNLKFVKSIGEQFLADLTVWKAAQKDSSLKNHKNFVAFDKELRNCNRVRKDISDYMQYDYLIPMRSINIVTYKDGSTALVDGPNGKNLDELGDTFKKKLTRYATQVAPIFGGEKDAMGKMILDQINGVFKANENSSKLIKKAREEYKKNMEKNEKYNPQKISVKNQSKILKEVKSRYKKNSSNIIDISPTYEDVRDELDSLGKEVNKHTVEGELLAKENGKYVKYTFSVIVKIIRGSSTTEYYVNVYPKSALQTKNVANKYRK